MAGIKGSGAGAPKGHPPYPGCETGGRPRIYTEEKLNELAESLSNWVEEAVQSKSHFLLADWCFENGFIPNNIPRYTKQSENFNEAYLKAKAWQEHMITKGALFGKLNPRFAQFMLSCHYDWKPKEVVEHQGKETIQVVHYGTQEPKKWSEGTKAEVQNANNDKDRKRVCEEGEGSKGACGSQS